MKSNNKVKFISRRKFLKVTGLTMGGLTAGPILFSELMAVPSDLLSKVSNGPGLETWINTVCRQCPGGCGISVRRIDNIPVYIKGNPIFPVNRGGVCPMAHSSLEVLFNPDRIMNPLKQVGTKGQDNWESESWDAALNTLIQRLKELVKNGQAHRIAFLNGDDSYLMRSLGEHFMSGIRSPNYFEDDTLAINSIATKLSQNIDEQPVYDLANSRYILNFGSNFLEEGNSPVYYQQLIGHLRSKDNKSKVKLIHIDSRINLTASNSDQWIPIRPGTHGALALGIAYILIANNLYDQKYIGESVGFKPFRDNEGQEHIGFESLIRANYYPEKVSEITGVPVDTILHLGKEFGIYQPSVAISDDVARFATNGGFTQWAIYCLNALVGNIQKEGGVFFPHKLPHFDLPETIKPLSQEKEPPFPAVGSSASVQSLFGNTGIDQFAEEISSSPPGLIDTLIIVDSNPVFHSRNKDRFIKALNKIDNVVYLGTFLDETAQQSNVILPDHSYLEKFDLHGPIPGILFSHLGLQQPVIEPVFNTRHAGDILIETGKAVLGNDLFPWENYQDLVHKRLESIYNSGEGAIISESSVAEWIGYLKQRGWKFQQYETFSAFQELFTENGGWWNPVDPVRSMKELFQTESNKFEFYSSVLIAMLEKKSTDPNGKFSQERQERFLGDWYITARGDSLNLPHYEPPFTRGTPEDYPLFLTVSQLLTNRNGKGASQPSMLEILGIQVGEYWNSWAEINPQTAKAFGLKEHGRVIVESENGRVQAEVRIFPGIRPGVIHLQLGLGHTSYGRYGTDIGVNVTDLLEDNFDSLTGIPSLNGTRVRVRPVVKGT
ncbi:MAG: molybdopterin-dependent oxidoreductase [Desulfobacterales bacterium]